MLGLLRAALVCVALLHAFPAVAAPLVVYGPGLDAADAAVAAKEILGTGDFRVHGSIDDLAGPADAPVIVGASVRSCAGEADPLDRVLIAVRNQVTDLEYAAALKALTAAVDTLPCGTESASGADIYELFFLQGFMHFNDGDQAAAKAAFTRAAAIDRTREWPKEYPPTARTLYLEAVQAAMAGDPAPVRSNVESLAVDGVTVDPAAVPALLEGGHLVVVDGEALWVQVPPREQRPAGGILITKGGKLSAGIAAGDATYASFLESKRKELKADSLLILPGVDLEAKVFRSGRFESPRSASTAGPGPAPGIALIAAGGGLLGGGLAMHLQAYTEGEPDDAGKAPVNEADYPGLLARNRAGFGLAIAGGVLIGTGIAVTIATSGGVPVAGWVAPGPDGVGFGIVGRF